MKIPKILLIKKEAPDSIADVWREEFPCKTIDWENSSLNALERRKPEDYNLLIIDAYQNFWTGEDLPSEYFRSQNSSLVVIGTSFQKNKFDHPLCKKLYDQTVVCSPLNSKENTKKIKQIIENLGFKFKSE